MYIILFNIYIYVYIWSNVGIVMSFPVLSGFFFTNLEICVCRRGCTNQYQTGFPPLHWLATPQEIHQQLTSKNGARVQALAMDYEKVERNEFQSDQWYVAVDNLDVHICATSSHWICATSKLRMIPHLYIYIFIYDICVFIALACLPKTIYTLTQWQDLLQVIRRPYYPYHPIQYHADIILIYILSFYNIYNHISIYNQWTCLILRHSQSLWITTIPRIPKAPKAP